MIAEDKNRMACAYIRRHDRRHGRHSIRRGAAFAHRTNLGPAHRVDASTLDANLCRARNMVVLHPGSYREPTRSLVAPASPEPPSSPAPSCRIALRALLSPQKLLPTSLNIE